MIAWRHAGTLSAVCVLICLTGASAAASRKPNAGEAAGIFAAVQQHAPSMPIACLPLRSKVSTVDPHYAYTMVTRRKTCIWGNGVYFLKRSAAQRWRVTQEFSTPPCDAAPLAVMKDLFGSCIP
jgi:hypothetical protein